MESCLANEPSSVCSDNWMLYTENEFSIRTNNLLYMTAAAAAASVSQVTLPAAKLRPVCVPLYDTGPYFTCNSY